MKQKVPSAIYSKEFREQAVKQVTAEGLARRKRRGVLRSVVNNESVGVHY
jgi:hypothetical protein